MDYAPEEAEVRNHLQDYTNYLEIIGAYELLSLEMWRAAFAEMIATGLLMFTLIASITASLNSNLEHSVLVALAVFTNIFLFLMVIAPITGGHLNPVISTIAAFEGVTTFARSAVYIMAQCTGSFLGCLLMQTLISQEAGKASLLGGCTLDSNGDTPGISLVDAFLLEFVCTFLLLFVGATVAFDKNRSKEVGLPWVCFMLAAPIALGVFVSITITGKVGYSGVGLNPARCLGPALVEGGSLWHGHWVFWVAPILACLVYHVVFKTFPNKGPAAPEGERDILSLGRVCFRSSSTPAYVHKSKATRITI